MVRKQADYGNTNCVDCGLAMRKKSHNHTRCPDCSKAYDKKTHTAVRRKWALDNPERMRASQRKHRQTPKSKETTKKYYENNKEKLKEKSTEWAKNNRERSNQISKEYKERHPEKIKAYQDGYNKTDAAKENQKRYNKTDKARQRTARFNEANPEKVKEYSRKHSKTPKGRATRDKWDNQPQNKIHRSMRKQVGNSLMGKKGGRGWETIVGYTLEDLWAALEPNLKPSMTQENYGKDWHIDHIIPQVRFNFKNEHDIEFKMCWCLMNLQPLSAKDNLTKNSHYAGSPDNPMSEHQEAAFKQGLYKSVTEST